MRTYTRKPAELTALSKAERRRIDERLRAVQNMKANGTGEPPRRRFNLPLVERLGRLGFAVRDLAAILETSEGLITQRLREEVPSDPELRASLPPDWGEFRQAYEKGRVSVARALRAKQIELALKGNERMLIHLGQHWLGQLPHALLDVKGEVGGSITFTIKADGDVIDLPDEATSDTPPATPGSEPPQEVARLPDVTTP